eukprot:TRINITY_DN11935_c0_g2_i1.p1 TRINITY_DN11935_c0_g2~~TRINITY_DN11935_c0_g2_i1.p1  ORF type:complete len:317 (-),score=67.71 TRINITY_DN11935_c0_g2_i1:233-1183(-)
MFGGGFFGGGGGDGGFFGGGIPNRFDRQYQCFPVSFIGRDDLEKGNKIVLPPSALDHLARLNISYPMLFELSNTATHRKTHSGVQEFIAEEGTCYLPYWMMMNLCLQEGDLIRVVNTSLPKGQFVKLQPLTSDFLDIHNPRAVLENSLRNFATLTVGDSIRLDYNSRIYEIEIVECKPSNAVSIIEADVNVDFAPPKDYKEPEPVPSQARAQAQIAQEEEEEEKAEEPKSKLFAGSGQRVDGKAIKASPAVGPAAAPVIDEFEDMPWKKRIPKGVKMVDAPFMYGNGHMTGKKAGGPVPTKISEEQIFAGDGKDLM